MFIPLPAHLVIIDALILCFAPRYIEIFRSSIAEMKRATGGGGGGGRPGPYDIRDRGANRGGNDFGGRNRRPGRSWPLMRPQLTSSSSPSRLGKASACMKTNSTIRSIDVTSPIFLASITPQYLQEEKSG